MRRPASAITDTSGLQPVPRNPHPAPPALEVRELSVRYGRHVAFRGVDFRVEPGSFVCVLGPNGSGKTSLIKVLAGILAPSAGHIRRVDGGGHDAVGYVPQVKMLDRSFPATALELVVSGLRGRWPFRVTAQERARALETLRRVGGEHLSERQLASLSGGELQRIYLARSLTRQPGLVLLDEPATGIDAAGARDLFDVLEEYQHQRRATVIMVTHDWNAAFHHATHVLLLNRHQISFGPSHAVLTEKNLRQAFGHVGHAHGMFREGAVRG